MTTRNKHDLSSLVSPTAKVIWRRPPPIAARPWPLLNVSIIRRIQSLAVTRSFHYSTFPVIGYYTTFPILDISSERHYLHFYSNIPLPDISITRRFSAPGAACVVTGQWHTEVWSRSDVTTWWTSLAGCVREGHLQAGRHGVQQSSWSDTSVLRPLPHHILWCRFSASSAFC